MEADLAKITCRAFSRVGGLEISEAFAVRQFKKNYLIASQIKS